MPKTATLPPQDHIHERVPPTATVDYDPLTLRPNADQPVTPVHVPSIPGFEILGELGRGGMGVVYKARQIGLNRIVALKMVLAGSHAGADMLARFKAEAEAVAKLQHPNVVQVFEVGEHEGCPYFALEFVDGGSLDKKINVTPQPSRQAAELVETLARAIHACHQKGIVHRDLKPANVLITVDGTPKVTDFGLVKQLDSDSGHTKSGAILGTPSYMAPEQASGQKTIGPAADVYALGAILYECLTGRPPFKAATALDTVLQVVSEEPVSVCTLQPNVPRELETICHKCLQKDGAKRYLTASGLADDVRRYLKGEPITARPVGQLERFTRWCRRNPVVAGLAGAAMAVFLIGVIASWVLAAWALAERSLAKQSENLANQRAGELNTANTNLEKTNVDLTTERGKLADAVKLAKTNEDLAIERADDALANLGQFQVANGLRELESGQFYQALRWFALPLYGEGANTPRTETYRNRLSNYWRLPQETRATRYIPVHSLQHRNPVIYAAFSPDGRHIVTTSLDKTARLWDLDTGHPAGTPLQHQGPVFHAAFSPDGRHIVTTSFDKTARLWDTATGQLVCPPLQHQEPVSHAAFSPDGHRVVTTSGDQDPGKPGEARVWDTATGQLVCPPLQHQQRVFHAAFSPDGRRIVTASHDKTARV